jgi:hypothetical protein
MMKMETCTCPGCGASVPLMTNRCPYCQQHFIPANADPGQGIQAPLGLASEPSSDVLIFQRATEPNEGAFTLSVPRGWLLQGGIYRSDLTRQVIDAQSIEAKLDFAVKQDSAGSVMIRWCPEIKYCDVRYSPAGMMGFFPPGSTVQGMVVSPVMTARQFLVDVVLPWAHPEANQTEIVTSEDQPLLCQRYQERMAALGVPTNFEYNGVSISFTYTENGRSFEEKAQSVIENMGPVAGGMWSNKDTILLRAPKGQLDRWEPLLRHVQESVQIDPHWLSREIVNQEFLSHSFLSAQQASIARDRRMLEVQQQIQQVDRQITKHRIETNAEIMNDNYLTLMELEEYVNPYTNEPETGSNQWHHRWVTEDGAEFYTDDETVDPNTAALLNHSDWQRTPVRPRRP